MALLGNMLLSLTSAESDIEHLRGYVNIPETTDGPSLLCLL